MRVGRLGRRGRLHLGHLVAPPGVTWGDGPGEVQVVQGPDTTRYRVTVTALSRAATGDTNHSFTIIKEPGEDDIRSCISDGDSNDAGGCSGGLW